MRRFLRAAAGSVGMVGSITLPLLLVSGMAAVDYARAVEARKIAQSALDTVVLSCARNEGACAGDLFSDNLGTLASDLEAEPKVSVVPDGDAYRGTATLQLKTLLGGLTKIAGASGGWFSEVSVSASAEVNTEFPYSEVVFVVDVSASIGGALPDLRSSASSLAGRVFDEGARNVSVIPFGASIRFPTGQGFERYLASATCDPADRCIDPAAWNGCFAPESFAGAGSTDPLADGSLNWNGDHISVAGNPTCPGPASEALLFSTSRADVTGRLAGLTMAHGTGTDLALSWARRALFEDMSMPFRNGNPSVGGRRAVVLFSDGLANDAGDVDEVRSDDQAEAIASTETLCSALRNHDEVDLFVLYVYGKAEANASKGTAAMTACAGNGSRVFHGTKEDQIPALFDLLEQEMIKSRLRLTT